MATPRPARTARVLLPTLLAVLLAGGCASSVAGTPAADPAPRPTAGVGADPVAWGDKVCGATLAYYQPLNTPPNYDGADLAGIKTRLSDYLGKVAAGIDTGKKQLTAAGESPVSGGDAWATAVRDMLDRSGTTIAQAKKDVDAIDPNDVQGFKGKLDGAQQKLRTISGAQGLDKIGPTPRLDKAFATAPKCVALKKINGPA